MNESMNDKAVCRTAPATPGLLNIQQALDWIKARHTKTVIFITAQTFGIASIRSKLLP